MALRKIVLEGDEVLTRKSREVEKFDKRLHDLIDDMKETMYQANGVGLAAPQVGILKRVVTIDIGDGCLELVNPEIIGAKGESEDVEGCLSVPGVYGVTVRPKEVLVIAKDRDGKEIHITATDLLARALCHEIDHLEGILFRQHVKEYVETEE